MTDYLVCNNVADVLHLLRIMLFTAVLRGSIASDSGR